MVMPYYASSIDPQTVVEHHYDHHDDHGNEETARRLPETVFDLRVKQNPKTLNNLNLESPCKASRVSALADIKLYDATYEVRSGMHKTLRKASGCPTLAPQLHFRLGA